MCIRATAVIVVVSLLSSAALADFWADANARIQQHRMGDVRVNVVDSAGNPVGGAVVDVRMTRHAFGWGTAAHEGTIAKWSLVANVGQPNSLTFEQNYARYMEALQHGYRDPVSGQYRPLFNRATIENGFQWQNWENPVRQPHAIEAFDTLTDYGLDIRGHAMIWQHNQRDAGLPYRVYDEIFNASQGYSPRYSDSDTSPAAVTWRQGLRQAALDHIAAIGSQSFAGGRQPIDWDVLNEHRAHGMLARAINPQDPRSVTREWFAAARAANPSANLFINDYSMLTIGGTTQGAITAYLSHINYLVNNGAEIDGIGFQGHIWSASDRVAGPQLVGALDTFAATGLRLQVTEFDMLGSGWTEPMKADYLREFLTAMYSHPSVDAVTMWGFWDGRHWTRTGAPLFDVNWNLKLSGQQYVDLVLDEWWTNLEGVTDLGGRYSGRGFLGLHEATVTVDGDSFVRQFDLVAGSNEVTVVVPEPATSVVAVAAAAWLWRVRAGRRQQSTVTGRPS